MPGLEFNLLACGIVMYGVSFLVGFLGLFGLAGGVLGKEAVPVAALWGGLLLQLGSIGIRWAACGHPPIFGTYEAALAGSWFMLLYAALSYRSSTNHYRLLALTAVPISIGMILYGLKFNTAHVPLTISERSLWVDFHALFSWLAFGGYAAAFCLAGAYLLSGSRGIVAGSLEALSDLVSSYTNIGFINHTIMFALGSYYSSILYGTWWQWDPVNSTSLITWLAYGLSIHMRFFYRWRGKKEAILSMVAFATAIVSYWGLIYLPPGSSYHVFDMEFRIH